MPVRLIVGRNPDAAVQETLRFGIAAGVVGDLRHQIEGVSVPRVPGQKLAYCPLGFVDSSVVERIGGGQQTLVVHLPWDSQILAGLFEQGFWRLWGEEQPSFARKQTRDYRFQCLPHWPTHPGHPHSYNEAALPYRTLTKGAGPCTGDQGEEEEE